MESESQASYFPINSILHLFTNLLRKENGSSLFHGNISLFRVVQYKTLIVDKDCGPWAGTTLSAH